MNSDLISRSALFPNGVFYVNEDCPLASFNELFNRIHSAPAVDALTIDQVAQILYDFTGSKYACNFNDNDEWLPMACDNLNECPDVKDELHCWKQFIKHYGERRNDDE